MREVVHELATTEVALVFKGGVRVPRLVNDLVGRRMMAVVDVVAHGYHRTGRQPVPKAATADLAINIIKQPFVDQFRAKYFRIALHHLREDLPLVSQLGAVLFHLIG